VFDTTGRLSELLLSPLRELVTALGFGGADLDRLYAVCDGKLFVHITRGRELPPGSPKRQ
jgi:hypothetical protein